MKKNPPDNICYWPNIALLNIFPKPGLMWVSRLVYLFPLTWFNSTQLNLTKLNLTKLELGTNPASAYFPFFPFFSFSFSHSTELRAYLQQRIWFDGWCRVAGSSETRALVCHSFAKNKRKPKMICPSVLLRTKLSQLNKNWSRNLWSLSTQNQSK